MTSGNSAAYVVDCPTGLAGDMLLAACLDLGAVSYTHLTLPTNVAV